MPGHETVPSKPHPFGKTKNFIPNGFGWPRTDKRLPQALAGLCGTQLRRSRKAAALTRFWQAVEQKRLLPLREVST